MAIIDCYGAVLSRLLFLFGVISADYVWYSAHCTGIQWRIQNFGIGEGQKNKGYLCALRFFKNFYAEIIK